MRRLLHTAAIPLVAALMLSAGCVTFGGKPAPPVYRYRLDYPAPAALEEAIPATMRIMQMRTASTYDRADIAYRRGAHGVGNYNYRRWAVDPGRMVGDLIARDLVEARLFRAVLQGPSALSADYVLDGLVERIEEQSDNGCHAHLRLRFTLAKRITPVRAEPLFQNVYEADEQCPNGTPEGLVEAMSAALSSVSSRLRSDLIETIGLGR